MQLSSKSKLLNLPFRRSVESRPVLPGTQPPCHVDEPKVSDDGAAVLQEDVLRLQVLVHDSTVMQVPHP